MDFLQRGVADALQLCPSPTLVHDSEKRTDPPQG